VLVILEERNENWVILSRRDGLFCCKPGIAPILGRMKKRPNALFPTPNIQVRRGREGTWAIRFPYTRHGILKGA